MWTQIFFCILSFMMLVGKGKVSNKSSLGETYVGEKYPSLELGKKRFLEGGRGGLRELGDSRDWREVPRTEDLGWSVEDTSGRLWG